MSKFTPNKHIIGLIITSKQLFRKSWRHAVWLWWWEEAHR